jgi:alpha-L-rhamnosidase
VKPAEPGYRRLHIRPRPGGGLTSARATHKTPYGTAECAWRIADGELELTLVVPPNSGATVELPGSDETAFDVGPGTHSWRYRYETPDARRLTVDDSVGEFLDDEHDWELVVHELNRAAPGNPFIVGMLRTLSRASLRQALGGVPQAAGAISAIEAALARE